MNEEKKNDSVNKENTIDILVQPKKKEEAQPIPHAPKKESTPAPARPASKVVREKKVGRIVQTSDRTRAIPVAGKSKAKTVGQIAQETRVGALPVKAKGGKTPARPAKDVAVTKEKKSKRAATYEEKKRMFSSMRSTVILALVYIGVVVGISAILSFVGIRWANDVFALVKDEKVAKVTIPENATISEVAGILDENELIEYPSVFRMYIGFKNRDADPPLAFKAGEYELSSTLNYDQIVSLIKDRKSRKIVTITIPEGFTVDEIIDLFTSQGIGTREGFISAVNEFDYDYKFMDHLDQIRLSDQRRYRLEGYLFPDTYEFYTDSSEVAIVDKMLAAFESHFEDGYYARLDEMKMNLDQVVTLASIVQKEGKFNSDFYPISGVFHNRLQSSTMKRLQSDATVQYCLEERKEELTYKDLEVQNPYNTYRNDGLPPSAICNPGWEAIQAALYPEEHRYYYFVSDTDGSTVFAKSEPEHLNNVAALKKAKENGTSID